MGIYSTKFALTDEYVFMTEETAKTVYGYTDDDLKKASQIIIKTNRGDEQKVIEKLKQLRIRGQIWSWQERLGLINQFGDSLLITANLTAFVAILISFTIIYILILINVMQKRSQIGILKAIGIEGKTIMKSYLIQSAIYGLLGVVFGIILTKITLQYLTIHPIQMPLGDVIPVTKTSEYAKSTVILIIASITAGYFAARSVIKEKILDSIFKG
jgi:ABC-type lipoprotein release transport system permease subunit